MTEKTADAKEDNEATEAKKQEPDKAGTLMDSLSREGSTQKPPQEGPATEPASGTGEAPGQPALSEPGQGEPGPGPEGEPAVRPERPEGGAPEQETAKPEPARQPAGRGKSKVSKDDNIVLVGSKPTMSYVMAVVTQFSGGASNVSIKARGRSISRAVDVAEVARKRFTKDVKCSIEIGTDGITDEQGRKVNVSSIDINLSK